MQPNIGIDEGQRKEIAKGLSKLLADTYTLYLKTHNFHWNVTGPHFQQLHIMFMDQYTEMWAAVDEVAERIRALGEFAPGGYKAFSELSSIKESEGHPDWQGMIAQLVEGHEEVIRTCRHLLPQVQEAHDESSAALIGDRMRLHEKTAWMLRSLLN
ncbi:MAG: DNA starvation/stationary phase protection protein [Planctomycetes bacterium]|nr:DNA starvation/stationary phase protection protein [Planctomycetota bacterium]MCA8934988.1 DNA starvation/stationary phase protection protein [Planctomycetota bacterium]MCA8944802.1 DNA starvation/stationary phase protection protein [Planctomycetota bacterium]